MEAKKAQQSLESTYKQLDSVSLKEASLICCWIYPSYISYFVFVLAKNLCKQMAACSVQFVRYLSVVKTDGQRGNQFPILDPYHQSSLVMIADDTVPTPPKLLSIFPGRQWKVFCSK